MYAAAYATELACESLDYVAAVCPRANLNLCLEEGTMAPFWQPMQVARRVVSVEGVNVTDSVTLRHVRLSDICLLTLSLALFAVVR